MRRPLATISTLALASLLAPRAASADDAFSPAPDAGDHRQTLGLGGAFAPLGREPTPLELQGVRLVPLLDLRLRGEYRATPLGDDGTYASPLSDHALLWERARLGLALDKGPVTAALVLQDVRGIGAPSPTDRLSPAQPELPVTEPHEAYVDVHTDDRTLRMRLGRQQIVVGDGRLVGRSDDLATGRSFDALRLQGRVGDFDLGGFAAMLASPGDGLDLDEEVGPGAQLYALDGTWHAAPWLGVELTALARFVREPDVARAPGDLYTAALRAFGDHRGVRYSVVGAFQAGRTAIPGDIATVLAGAAAGRGEWETSLPLRLTFGVQAAYATGGADEGTEHATFDPLFADTHAHFGQAAFWGWSNVIEAGGDVALHPFDELAVSATYRYAALADPAGAWVDGLTGRIGRSPGNGAHALGHALGANARLVAFDPFVVAASWSMLVVGDGAQAVYGFRYEPALPEAPAYSQFAMLDARVALP